MKKILIIIMIFLLHLPLASFSDETISCDPPQGTRVDYFSRNSINLQNDTFLMSRDKISGMNPRIVLMSNHQDVLFTIGDTSEMKSQPKHGNMKVLLYNENQISFTGMVNGAPILASYYPQLHILIYSQQSIWPGPNYQGLRAVMFYAKCTSSQ